MNIKYFIGIVPDFTIKPGYNAIMRICAMGVCYRRSVEDL